MLCGFYCIEVCWLHSLKAVRLGRQIGMAVGLWAQLLACPDSEGGGHEQHLGAEGVHQLLVHGWEPQVVAHGQAQAAHRAIACH